MLGILALAGGNVVPTSVLTDRLWADTPPVHLRAALHSAIAKARRQTAQLIQRGRDGYRLAIDPDAVDVLRMERLLDAAAFAAEPRQRELLEAALASWGEPFASEPGHWLHRFEGPRLIERYLQGLERRIDLDLSAGRHDRLCDELLALTTTYRLREPLWQRLLLALSGAGRRAEALAKYEELRTDLSEALGVAPGKQLQELHLRLLRDDDDAHPLPTAGTRVVLSWS
nr:AfsR/SARP family transcriptional regulator [Kribbella sandramycini]